MGVKFCPQLKARIRLCGDVMSALTHRQLHKHKHAKPATLCIITWLLPHSLVTQLTTSILPRGATSTCFKSRSCQPDLKYFTSSTLAHSHGSISELLFSWLGVRVVSSCVEPLMFALLNWLTQGEMHESHIWKVARWIICVLFIQINLNCKHRANCLFLDTLRSFWIANHWVQSVRLHGYWKKSNYNRPAEVHVKPVIPTKIGVSEIGIRELETPK